MSNQSYGHSGGPQRGSFGNGFAADPFPVFAQMRAGGPVSQIGMMFGRRAWLVTQFDAAVRALKDPRLTVDPTTLASRDKGFPVTAGFFGGRSMIDLDEPDHARLRTLVSKAFTPRYVENLRPRIQGIADALLDEVQPRGSMDLVEEYAYPLPINVICGILGVPIQDRDELLSEEYAERLVAEKRRHPQDDLISQLVRIEEAGDRLNEDELRGMVGLLIFAGHETTSNLIGNGTLALLDHPGQLARLRADLNLIPSAVEELLRFSAPVVSPAPRFAKEDIPMDGQMIRRGDVVMVAVASANRDEAQFTDPEDLNIARSLNRHIAFGQGIHYCLGAPLARLEGQIAFTTLLSRMPGLRLAVPRDTITWRGGLNLRGLVSLPVAW